MAAYIGYRGESQPRQAEASHEAVEFLMSFAPEMPAYLKSTIPNPYGKR